MLKGFLVKFLGTQYESNRYSALIKIQFLSKKFPSITLKKLKY